MSSPTSDAPFQEPSKYSVSIGRADDGEGGAENASFGDGVSHSNTTFLPKLLYRNNTSNHFDDGIKGMSRRYKDFGRATLSFNVRSFFEEFVSHTGSIVFGPFFAPISVACSGKIGAQITGFLPGKIKHEGKTYNDPTENFVNQSLFYFLFDLPIFLAMVLFLTGTFQPVADDSPDPYETRNSSTAVGPDAAYTIKTEVLFIGEVIIPGFILVLRQVVIAVKYAYIPRKHIRDDREAGRNMEAWNDELMVPWCMLPSARMITHNARLACERARIDPHVMVVEFAKPFCQNGWEIFSTPETNEDAKERAMAEKKMKKEKKKGLSTTVCKESKLTPPTDTQLPLWRLIHYSVWHGSKGSTGLGFPPFLLMGLIGALIPPLYKIVVLRRAAFGTTSLDKWISACSFLSYFMQGSGAVWLFSYCAGKCPVAAKVFVAKSVQRTEFVSRIVCY